LISAIHAALHSLLFAAEGFPAGLVDPHRSMTAMSAMAMSATAATMRVPVPRRARPVIARLPVKALAKSPSPSVRHRSKAAFAETCLPATSSFSNRKAVIARAEEDSVGDKVVNVSGSAEEEAAGLAAVRATLDKSQGCPAVDDETVLWFLRDRRMDAEAAAEKLEEFLRWRQDLGPITEKDITASLRENAAYVHPHLDKQGRAVIVVEISKHILKNRDLDAAKKHAVWAVEKCLTMMEESSEGSGGIYAVWDMRGFSGANADLDLAKFCILDVFRKYYPKRLEQVAAVDSPWAFKPIWAVLKPIIGKYSSVVKFVKVKDVLENFNEGEAPACLTEGAGR